MVIPIREENNMSDTKKKITDKIKEMLSPSDLKVFEDAVEKLVDKRVALKEEELKNKYDTLAEEYCTKKIAEETEKAKATLIEGYDEKLNNLEKKIVGKLDSYIDHMIAEQISDETLKKIAINEVAYPLVQGMKKLFAENYVELDSQGTVLLKQKDEKIKELEEKVASFSKKVVESEERLEKSASFLLISEKTDGLTDTQKQRVVKMFKNKKFDEIKENIDEFISMIKESNGERVEVAESKKADSKSIDSVLTEAAASEPTKEKKVIKEDTFAGYAEKYMD
jgi:hypothetical protein